MESNKRIAERVYRFGICACRLLPDSGGRKTREAEKAHALARRFRDQGRCVKRTTGASSVIYYIYDGERPIYEFDPNGGTPSINVYGRGIDEILYRSNNGSGQYFMQDHEGSVIVVTGGDGSILEWYRYDAFGAPTIRDPSNNQLSTTAINNRFLFTGREYTPQFGFYGSRARAYHPTIGRFMSEDPNLFVRRIGLDKPVADSSDAKAPEGGKSKEEWSFWKSPDQGELNLFRYCSNDPLDRFDPLGLIEFFFDESFGAAAQAKFNEAIKLGSSTSKRGNELANMPGDLRVAATDKTHPTGFYPKEKILRLDPHDPAFLDPKSRADFNHHPTELPPDGVKGRATTVFHEVGHFAGGRDENEYRGHNVRDNENPVRRGLKLEDRKSYKGVPINRWDAGH